MLRKALAPLDPKVFFNPRFYKAPKPSQGDVLIICTDPIDMDASRALHGFLALGHNCYVSYETRALRQYFGNEIETLSEYLLGFQCVVADVISSRKIFGILGIQPKDITYPQQLRTNGILGRTLEKMELFEALKRANDFPVFIKPANGKAWPAVIADRSNATRLGTELMNHLEDEVWVSFQVKIKAEYRAFILNQKIMDIRPYAFSSVRSLSKGYCIEELGHSVQLFNDAPAAFVMDFFVNHHDVTFFLECNDGYAFGSYGLDEKIYAQMLLARWQELTQQTWEEKTAKKI